MKHKKKIILGLVSFFVLVVVFGLQTTTEIVFREVQAEERSLAQKHADIIAKQVDEESAARDKMLAKKDEYLVLKESWEKEAAETDQAIEDFNFFLSQN